MDDKIAPLIDYLLDEYGDHIFSVVPGNLMMALDDIVREAESHGLRQALPPAFNADGSTEQYPGDYEIFVDLRDDKSWVVGVFAIHDEE